MATTSTPGPQTACPPAVLDEAVEELRAGAKRWRVLPAERKAGYLRGLLSGLARVAPGQVRAACAAKGLAPGTPAEGEEWLGGIVPQARTLRILLETVEEIAARGHVAIPARTLRRRRGGHLAVRVLPHRLADRLLFAGFDAEVRLQAGVTEREVRREAGGAVVAPPERSRVAAVLGAGNVAAIAPLDVVHKLFAEGMTAILKLNPVNAYLGPFIEDAFAELVRDGYVRVVYGGADVGARLCEHDGIDAIHLTGSARTHDAIVWGTGAEAARRREHGEPRVRKQVTSELGNVSPVIVVPGDWTRADLRFHAQNVATQMTQNGGFNCNAAKVLVTQAEWRQREEFLETLRSVLGELPPRPAYYPGAEERFERFVQTHGAEVLGTRRDRCLPAALATGLDPDRSETLAFREESFCPFSVEAPLAGEGVEGFLRQAVRFCNETLNGTLSACLIVDPRTRRGLGGAVEDAVDALHYGAVALNHWPAVIFALGSTTWGAYPGHTPSAIVSGIGTVHNARLLPRPEKSVLDAPFRTWPRPPWFVTHRRAHAVGRRLALHELRPSLGAVPSIATQALLG